MTDFVTTHITAANPPADGLVTTQWYQDPYGQSFATEMRAALGGAPVTPVEASGGGGRPSTGLVWPH